MMATLCILCGLVANGDSAICPHHVADYFNDDGWAANNRLVCDLIHRGQVPPRLSAAEREDEFWAVGVA